MCVKRCVKTMLSFIFMDTVEIFISKLVFTTILFKLSNYVLSVILFSKQHGMNMDIIINIAVPF